MSQRKPKDYDNFLKELTALTQKYKIQIEGCGCCGSPWLSEVSIKNKAIGYEVQADLDGRKHTKLTWSN